MSHEKAYRRQRNAAKHRGIEWGFSYDTWLAVWSASGHLQDRGIGRGKYVMARPGDVGPYAPQNVEIILCASKPLDAVYGRNTVIGRIGHYAICVCSCGSAPRKVDTAHLRAGECLSCGCLAREMASKRSSERKTHGMSLTRDYRSWQKMLNRCTNQNYHQYADYGGRGIKVCQRWADSFEAFYADMGPRPEGKSIDRFPDNDGNYEPGNCRWATYQEQARNNRRNHFLCAFGETKLIAEWADDPRCKVGHGTLRGRVRRGYDHEWSITAPPIDTASNLGAYLRNDAEKQVPKRAGDAMIGAYAGLTRRGRG